MREPDGLRPVDTQEPGEAPTVITPTQPHPDQAQPMRESSKPTQRGMSRRAALLGAAGGVAAIAGLGAGAGYALTHWPGAKHSINLYASDAARITHLLRRAGFGASPADLTTYLNLGLPGSLDRLLNYTNVANDVDQRLAAYNFDLSTHPGQISWWLARMTLTQRPLEEKLTLFWHGVLTSSYTKIGGKRNLPLIIQQNNLLRAHAMGRFDDLIRAISTDPAMLWWLDGRLNTGSQPNENYSRELMELFTMGIGNYSQDDVRQGAKALSGWVIRGGKGVFAPARFYTGDITYLGQSGHLGLDDVVRIVCASPATARRLSALLWSFFVWDNPSASDIQPLVDAYTQSDHNIGAMVKAMFNAPAFLSAKAYRARVKSPTEFIVGAVRALGFEPTRQALTFMIQSSLVMGQTLFDPPNVAGWPGDRVSGAWLTTQSWITRVNFVNSLLEATTSGRDGPSASGTSSVLEHLIQRQDLRQPTDIVTYFAAMLLDSQLASDRHAIILDALTGGGEGANLSLPGGGRVAASALRQALYLLMSMPEYQMN